jgi:signal transduction histidine kinase
MTAEVARLDADCRLVTATPRLARLNEAAGGRIGAPIAVPAIARLAATAAALRLPLARRLLVSDGGQLVELQADARPADECICVSISAWSTSTRRGAWLVPQPSEDVEPSWSWSVDARLRLTALDLAPGDPAGAAVEALIGQPLTQFVRLIEDDLGELPMLVAVAEGRSFENQRAVRRDRPHAEITLSGAPLVGGDGRHVGYSGRATPLAPPTTESADAPVMDGALAQQLETAMRAALDRIVARADAIAAQGEGPLRRDYVEYAGDIARAGRHLLGLVEGLADAQAIEAPGFAVLDEAIDLAELARQAAGLLAVRAADRGVRIDRPGVDETIMARGDYQRVLQILVNLLSNAVRYSPPGAMIWIRSETDTDTAIIVVADQGKGIAPADHARVFEKFERVDPTEPGGSGLGLYISRRLARAMGGNLTLDSAPGQGARFVLTLPVR